MARRERAIWVVLGMMLGITLMYCWQQTPAVRGAVGVVENKAGPQVLVDEKEMRLSYANAYRIHTTEQEAVIDFGFNMPNPNQKPGEEQQVLLKVTDRMVLSYVTSKRLSLSMAKLVKRFEDQFGEIPAAIKEK